MGWEDGLEDHPPRGLCWSVCLPGATLAWPRVSALLRGVGLCLAFALTQVSFADELLGRVVGVMDGDTVDVLTPMKELVRVRLSGIDAPERKQAFGNVAKQKLSDLVFSRDVVVEWHKKDRYGRIVGKILVNRVDANLQMVDAGMAWHYKQYMAEQPLGDRLSYMHAETAAREKHIGLWRDADPIPPWEFRHSRHKP